MSGGVASHAAYNNSGTQALAVTNDLKDTGDVQSVYWNANNTTRQLVYGSALVDVPANAGSGTSVIGNAITQVFDVNNDIDCLGDMILTVEVTGSLTSTKTKPLDAVKLISRIELQVGTQIWQTLELDDILSVASTEVSPGAFNDFAFQTSGGVSNTGEYTDTASATTDDEIPGVGSGIVAHIPLKAFTKTLAPNLEYFVDQTESGYLMAAAPHQQVKVKVVTTNGDNTNFKETADFGTNPTVTLSLLAKSQIMCNEEREALKSMAGGVPKRIKMTQHATKTASAAGALEIDLDQFSLFASHLLISIPTTPGTLTKVGERTVNTTSEVELLLNSSSYSGKLPLGLLRMTGSSMGLYTNAYRVNSLNNAPSAVYVFPLASRAYGASSVPLNRFDNIRLKLTGMRNGDVVTVTCVGETTALYANGAASLAMY